MATAYGTGKRELSARHTRVLLQGGSNQGSSEQEVCRPHGDHENHPNKGGSKDPTELLQTTAVGSSM